MLNPLKILLFCWLYFCSFGIKAQEQKVESSIDQVKDLETKANIVKDSVYIALRANGDTLQVGHYQDGKKVGEWRDFFLSGGLKSVEHYTSDVLEGSYRTYFLSGSPRLIGAYSVGKKVGIWKAFYENDSLRMVVDYQNGIATGKALEYYDNGRLRKVVYHQGSDSSGCFQVYNRDGQLAEVGQYDLNTKPDPRYIFKPDSLLGSGDDINGDRIGAWHGYHANGQLFWTMCYEKDQLVGFRKTYYDNGQLGTIGYFIDGKLDGEFKRYHKNGVLASDYVYVNGRPDGISKTYYDNGMLREVRLWDNGALINSLTLLSPDGSPLYKGEFSEGNGWLNLYDGMGMFKSSLEYVDGHIVK